MRTTVTAICGFTMLASCWLFVMFLVLRHPGFEWHAVLSLGFVAVGGITMAAGWMRTPGALVRAAAGVGGVALGAVGAWAMHTNVDEGFVDVIGLAFIVQAIVTVVFLIRGAGPRPAARTLS